MEASGMKNAQTQLVSIAAALTKLTKQLEKLSADLEISKPARKAPAEKVKAAPKKKAVPPVKKMVKAEEKVSEKAPEKSETVLQQVYDVICKSRKGASIDKLKEKTRLDPRQLSNALYKLTKKGVVEARARGIYFKKK
jgi:predicted Rossmann fold nucleotide-binding protein DprA/Smf involved in DNA uptake